MAGKSDFNENPVVSLDLDLDFGLRLRVCQNLLFYLIQVQITFQMLYLFKFRGFKVKGVFFKNFLSLAFNDIEQNAVFRDCAK